MDLGGFFERLAMKVWFLNLLSRVVTTYVICRFFMPNVALLNRDMYLCRDSPFSCITCMSPIAVFFFRALLENEVANLFTKLENEEIDCGGNVSNHSLVSFLKVMENALQVIVSSQPCNLTQSWKVRMWSIGFIVPSKSSIGSLNFNGKGRSSALR
ncbi:hypothetical protein Adt_38603 [Abeliophyllum distichum]|uniref:Uncharacterized protein n=1 Tax=Abeliophyllum distichum TaxID=126358 RepID=A0ABD1Q3P5_9LAMI